MTSTYREELRRTAATNDAAFAEYMSDLVERPRFAEVFPWARAGVEADAGATAPGRSEASISARTTPAGR